MRRYFLTGLSGAVLVFTAFFLSVKTPLFVVHRVSLATCAEIKAYIAQTLALFMVPVQKLVVLDADDTLIMFNGAGSGSAPWFNEAMKHLKNMGLSFRHARDILFPLYKRHLVQRCDEVALTEYSWVGFLSSLEKNAIPKVLLTRRSPELAELTHELLEKYGLTFTADYFGEDDRTVVLADDKARYSRGGIFCGLNTKKQSFGHFLEERHKKIPYEDTLVVYFCDDDTRYLAEVGQALEEFAQKHSLKVVYHQIHYTGALPQNESVVLDSIQIAELEEAYKASNGESEAQVP